MQKKVLFPSIFGNCAVHHAYINKKEKGRSPMDFYLVSYQPTRIYFP